WNTHPLASRTSTPAIKIKIAALASQIVAFSTSQPQPSVLDPRPNRRNPCLSWGTPQRTYRAKLQPPLTATRPKCAPGHGGRGAAVSGKVHRIHGAAVD
ncbi:hypothetical protein K474DRAFT_1670250, partial [Panus rudis PR-1116 ss-1]